MPASPTTFAILRQHTIAELVALLDSDAETAATWLRAAAVYGFVEAQLAYAQCLLDGRGVERDQHAAFRWFATAAKSDSPAAINMLGRCHENGWGTPADVVAAAPLYRKAAEAGLDWGQYNLANLLARGGGVPKDLRSALMWYRRAAAQEHAKSINLVGRFLEEGWVVPRDWAAAAECYRRAAEKGDFRGQYNYATVLHRDGQVQEAASWFRRAATTGTSAFLRSMARTLITAREPQIRAVALETLGALCQTGEPEDLCTHARVLLESRQRKAGLCLLRQAAAAGSREAADILLQQGRMHLTVARVFRSFGHLARRQPRRYLPRAPKLRRRDHGTSSEAVGDCARTS